MTDGHDYDATQQPEGALPGAPRGRCASLVLGVAFVIVGIPMLLCPGPGVAVILAGVALLGYGITGRRREPPSPVQRP